MSKQAYSIANELQVIIVEENYVTIMRLL